jgi:hypothetical protein
MIFGGDTDRPCMGGDMKTPGFRSFVRLAIVSAGVWLAACLTQPAKAASLISDDGLVADLQVSGDRALVRWRFLGVPTSTLKEISGDIDGQLLGTPRVSSYPEYGDVTRVLILIDPTGPDRKASVNKQIAEAIELTQTVPEHVQLGFGIYSTETKILVPRDFNNLLTTLASVNIPDEHPDLLSALYSGIKLLLPIPAQRKALFIFTDGHSDVPIKPDSSPNCADCAGTVADLARQSGISVSFILADSSRSKDLDPLRKIASRSGGRVVKEADTPAFLVQPLTDVDNGGSALFPVPQQLTYFWQRDPKVTITFDMGASKLELSSPASPPRATTVETARYIGSNHPFVAGGAGLAVLALAAGVGFLVRRPRRGATADETEPATGADVSSAEVSERRTVRAVLQNIDDGTSHAISSERISIGRAASNDIVIDDQAVSREHAVLLQNGDGAFVVENKGTNGTFVNHLQVDQAELAAGDLITIGDTTLRFMPTKT